MKPTLLVLAAGMGSRYGGLKQMDGLGPSGETIIDYSIHDAAEAGFGKIVYIVREYFLEDFKKVALEKYSNVKCADGSPLKIAFVTQELDKIPEGFEINPERVKPWGTAHAVLMAADVIKEPFAVINGDDFYGKQSFRIMGDYLRSIEGTEGNFCMVGFKLDNTLSESGGVSRGICSFDAEGNLTDVEEHHEIAFCKECGKIYGENPEGKKVELNGELPASMNMWGFTPDYFAKSLEWFKVFLKENSTELKKEFYIPWAIDKMINNGQGTCKVLTTPDKWFGVTFKEDRQGVVDTLADMVKKNIYPSPLW
ncbi:MAG: nucleotidyltransferase [Bacteroidales bacterium]|nr:nucleotidyltransferase [Bacteroidales bacterium]